MSSSKILVCLFVTALLLLGISATPVLQANVASGTECQQCLSTFQGEYKPIGEYACSGSQACNATENEPELGGPVTCAFCKLFFSVLGDTKKMVCELLTACNIPTPETLSVSNDQLVCDQCQKQMVLYGYTGDSQQVCGSMGLCQVSSPAPLHTYGSLKCSICEAIFSVLGKDQAKYYCSVICGCTN